MPTTHRQPWLLVLTFLIFLGFIALAYLFDVRDYVNDSIFILILSTFLYILYPALALRPWIYLLLLFAFSLHNLGMFGYYNISPLFLQWDHVTHLIGIFAAGVLLYNYFQAQGWFVHKNKLDIFILCLLVIFAALGIGVFVEFMEFYGYLVVGDGLGIFGHGLGDINTEFINSEWFNTLFDLLYNFLGAVIAVLICRYTTIKKYLAPVR